MKKRFYIKTAFFSLAAMALLSSCLKDSRYIDYSKVGTLVELPLAEVGDQAGIGGPFQTIGDSLHIATTYALTVAVNVASPTPLSTPLNVTLSNTDLTYLNAYNAASQANGGPTYQPLPAADYTINSSLSLVVPANQRLAYAKFTINLAAVGVANSGAYVLPITITNASGQPIAQPEKALLYNVIVAQ